MEFEIPHLLFRILELSAQDLCCEWQETNETKQTVLQTSTAADSSKQLVHLRQ